MALDVYKDWLGISEEIPRPPDLYSLLRLSRFEDEADKIRAHYKKLNAHVRKYATGTYQLESQELLNELAKGMLCLTDPERKREYDEGLGRTFEDEDDVRPTISQTLVRRGIATREQMTEAKDFAEKRGLSIRDAVVQMKLTDAETATEALAGELGLPYVDLEQLIPDDSILAKVPRNVARRNSVLPLFVDDDMLLVACVDEPTHELEDELRLRVGVSMRRVIASPLAINQAIAKYYAGLEAGASDKAEPEAKKTKEPRKKTPRAGEAGEDFAETHQRKQLGIILMCWSIALPVVLDIWVVPGTVTRIMPDWFPYVVSPLVSPVALFLVWSRFFRKR